MVLGHDLSKGQRTRDVRISDDISFDTMLLRSATYKGLKKAGFFKPSPIQLHAIPLGKCGFDLLLEAKSGTGKTAVFTVIALEKLNLNNGLQTIVLAPTREIASQISSVITEIGSKYKGLNVAVVMGGLPVKDDIDKLKENVHIVVGSPGRLRHLIQANHIDVSSVRLFVLDEADKLMENCFQPDINYIFSLLPKQKQVIMSSATYTEETKLFISKYVQRAQYVCPDSNSVLLGIEQKVTIVPYNSNIVKQTKHRYEELKKILNEKQFKQCLVFCNYQVRVGEIYRMLSQDKWPAEQLYGLQEQTDRLDALKTLQEYKCRILVSTDLAARGLDASNVDIVINFEPPFEWQTYLHRIGRAGRYGSYGTAITILSEGKEKTKFQEVLGHANIPFEIQGLWDDELFSLRLNPTDHSVEKHQATVIISSKTTSSINDDKTEDLLWNALTKESSEQNNDNKQDISSFEGLCDSFKMSTITSFSDLMDSFTEEQNKLNKNTDSSEYKHVNMTKLPIKNFKYWNSSQAKCIKRKNEFSDSDTSRNHIEPSITNWVNGHSLNNQIPTQKENERHVTGRMEKESLKLVSDCENKKSETNIRIQHFQMSTKESVKQKEDVQSNKSDEIEMDPTKQALLDAGLPTAFGKINIKSYINSNSKSDNFKIKKSQDEQLTKHRTIKAQHNDEKEIIKIHSNKTFTEKYYLSNTDESDQSKSSIEISNDINPTSKLKNYYANYASSTLNNAYCHQKNYKKYKNRVKNRSKQFNVWYDQLKYQMQFIQYTLYIEEFRKL